MATSPADFALPEPKQKQKLNSKAKPTRTAEQKAARKQAADAKKAARLHEQLQADLSADLSRRSLLAQAEEPTAAPAPDDAQDCADLSAEELEEAFKPVLDAIHRQFVAFKSIDDRECLALSALEAKRRSPGGRAVEFFMGERHFEAQRKAIMARFEAERDKLRCDFPSEFPNALEHVP